MAAAAIIVNNLSKQYIIKHEYGVEAPSDTLSGRMAQTVKKITSGGKRKQKATKEAFYALKEVSFTVEKGNRVGIIGRNGAGKSTLLKILSRITEATSGTMELNGRVVSLLEVGTGFHPELTGRENIYLNGVIMGMNRAEINQKFDEIVAFSEIGTFLDTPVKRFSSGMYMRLAFSIAAHIEPDILILDEMLAVGDAQFQKKCLAKMDEISKTEGRTVLFVSHDIEAISSFCNQGIYLQGGKVVAQGPIEAVVKEYMGSIHDGLDSFQPHSHLPVYFKSLRFENPRISFGDDLKLHIELISAASHPQYLIGLNISDITDSKVAGNILFMEQELKKGSNKLTLTLPTTNMVPDGYALNIAVALSREMDNIDVVLGYPDFRIQSNGKAGKIAEAAFEVWSRSWGGHIFAGIQVQTDE